MLGVTDLKIFILYTVRFKNSLYRISLAVFHV